MPYCIRRSRRAMYGEHIRSGKGWEEDPDIERRLLDALFEAHRNLANYRYYCLEHCNGRCPGCDCIMNLVMIHLSSTLIVGY